MRPGDSCKKPDCRGTMIVYTTRVNFITEMRTRYMKCNTCGDSPECNKWVIPMIYAPKRASKGVEQQ